MKNLQFKKLWLVSETSRSARVIDFHPKMTMLVGRNHTGKSTLIKHIFRTLGCETKGKTDRWDSNAISVLFFEIDGRQYVAFRRANVLALRDVAEGRLIVTIKSSEWTEIIAELFEFHLRLETHQGDLAQATAPYLFLPYYFDQDGSWTNEWHSFENLTQFTKWKKPLIAYFTGQKPNEYYLARHEETKARAELAEMTRELGVVESAFSRVRKTLPASVVQLDAGAFKQEISDLIRKSSALKQEQEKFRKKAFEQSGLRESLNAQIAMAKEALRDIEGDLKYLAESKVDPTILCPTCGTEHENGFPVRLEMVDDAVSMRKIVSELEQERMRADASLASIQGDLNRVGLKIVEIERTLQKKKGDIRLHDVVNSQSVEVVRGAFQKDLEAIRKSIVSQEAKSSSLREKVSKYDVPERTKSINEFYAEHIALFASELGVQDLREDVMKRPDASVKTSGSALPRALLAYHYAILQTAREKGDAKLFPVVVDSPNQQGQDKDHLAQMLKFIVKRTPAGQQLVLAVEDMPVGLEFDGDVINLDTPYGLLLSEQYEVALNELQGLIDEVSVGLDIHLASKRLQASEEV